MKKNNEKNMVTLLSDINFLSIELGFIQLNENERQF